VVHPVEATILHADLDAFYASVEQLLDPGLRGKPIAVGGEVVLAASYEAKAFGVHGGMPAWRARRLCPQLQFVGSHFGEYQRVADRVMRVLGDFTPLVERISVDEAFLDVAGSTHLFGSPAEIAQQIRRRVREEIGLPVSIGVATTKHLAKVASQVAKPDGLVVVEPGEERSFLDPLPVGLLWGVGPVTRERLAAVGVDTIGQLAKVSPGALEHLVGRSGAQRLSSLIANEDARRVAVGRRSRSVGAQAALGRQVATAELLRSVLARLADRVATRLRAARRAGRTVTVRVRFAGMRAVSRSATVPTALCSTRTLTELAVSLARSALEDHPAEREITLLAVAVSNLVDEGASQLELPLGTDPGQPPRGRPSESARLAVDRAIDAVRARYGRDAVGYVAATLTQRHDPADALEALHQLDGARFAEPRAEPGN
jgi:DNA polymerase-4